MLAWLGPKEDKRQPRDSAPPQVSRAEPAFTPTCLRPSGLPESLLTTSQAARAAIHLDVCSSHGPRASGGTGQPGRGCVRGDGSGVGCVQGNILHPKSLRTSAMRLMVAVATDEPRRLLTAPQNECVSRSVVPDSL